MKKNHANQLIIFFTIIAAMLTGFAIHKYKPKQPRSYQLQIYNDTMWLYDGDRLVSKVLNRWNSPLDSAILKDNN